MTRAQGRKVEEACAGAEDFAFNKRNIVTFGTGVELAAVEGQHNDENQRHEEAGRWSESGTGQSVEVRLHSLLPPSPSAAAAAAASIHVNNTRFVCSLAEVINVKILEDIFRNVEGNTKQLVDAGAVGERSAISLGIIQVRLASPPPPPQQ